MIYLLTVMFYLVNLFFRSEALGKISTGAACLGLGVHTIAFFCRWVESYQLDVGHIPIRGLYEGLIFLAGSSVLVYLIIEFKIKTRAFALLVFPMVSLLMVYASLGSNVESRLVPLPAVLRGNYITSHMLTWFLCYTFLFISFAASILIVLKVSPLDMLDDVNYKTVAVGFIMLSIGLVTGMFRTKIIWGSYWNWDPIQTWSLITWLIYALIIHGRLVWGWEGAKTALLSIIGFIIAVYTFLVGAHFISSSGHFAITS